MPRGGESRLLTREPKGAKSIAHSFRIKGIAPTAAQEPPLPARLFTTPEPNLAFAPRKADKPAP